MGATFTAIADPRTDRIQLHAAGCADVRRTTATTGRESWPIDAATLDAATVEAGFGFEPDSVDVKPCAQWWSAIKDKV